jgi:hypothetical protein
MRQIALRLPVEHLEAAALPRGVRGQPQPTRNDPVDFLPHQNLGERDLVRLPEDLDRFVTDFQQRAARDRVLVILDFALDEQLVFVLE